MRFVATLMINFLFPAAVHANKHNKPRSFASMITITIMFAFFVYLLAAAVTPSFGHRGAAAQEEHETDEEQQEQEHRRLFDASL
jgi:predicted PurR-regulated permease PerM